MPKVSICMAVRNGEKYLFHAMRSLQLQTLENWELIIIDDCSSDNTPSVINSFNDKRFRVFRNKINMGLAFSLNKAISLAEGEFIARMDADDISFPDRISRQVNYLDENPSVDLVGGQVLMFQEGWMPVGVMALPLEHEQICKRAYSSVRLFHPCWLGRARWFKENKYNESFKKAQDYEILLRNLNVSRYANLPDVILGYRCDDGNLSKKLSTRCYVFIALYISYGLFRTDFWKGVFVLSAKVAVDFYTFFFRLNKIINEKKVDKLNAKLKTSWENLIENIQ